MNTNAIHNLLNAAIIVVSALGAFDWSGAFGPFGLSPEAALTIVSAASALKLVINAIRDGLAGMLKNQPPVK